ncbi:MAG: NTP transferase domain-containing protein [Prevotellaceae bacterium]|jgi:choline kinase|nr:NTP transferase domain-containing protein [Prevotellaceae bacterium]
MQNDKHAIISAAGLGSRLGLNIPKCLIEINGKTLIEYQLELLKKVEDIRIIVGFMEHKVIDLVRKIRDDVVFVRNPDYKTTSNAFSVHLGTHDLKYPFIIIDGDLLIEKASFDTFLEKCNGEESVIGITQAKTEDAVFVTINEPSGKITKFHRTPRGNYEWTGIAYLKNIPIKADGKYVFTEIVPFLPLAYHNIVCYEIDTPEDLDLAINNFDSIINSKA